MRDERTPISGPADRACGRTIVSGARGGVDVPLGRLVAALEGLDLDEFGLGVVLRGLGFLELRRQFGDRALEIVAPRRRARA